MRLSERLLGIEESGTVKLTSVMKSLRKKGEEIIDFAVGEPDLNAPEEVKDATKKALDNNKTRYCQVSGLSELKEKICSKLKEDGLSYSNEEILISNGSKQSLYNIFQAICNKGDEVILQRPCWVSYCEQVKLAEGKPVLIDTIDHQLDIEKIKKSITEKTRAIVVNSPNNPTGAVYKRTDLKAIADIATDNDLYVVSDQAYDSLVYDGIKSASIASFNDEIKKRAFVVKTFSKEFSMTGFRVGYVACNEKIVLAMNSLQGHTTGNVCTFAQYGALAALDINREDIEKKRALFEKKRNLAYKKTKEIFDCIKPSGAFYLFPDVTSKLDLNMRTSKELSEFLLKKTGVATVPGEAFRKDGHIRISFASSEENIKKGFEKMSEVL